MVYFGIECLNTLLWWNCLIELVFYVFFCWRKIDIEMSEVSSSKNEADK